MQIIYGSHLNTKLPSNLTVDVLYLFNVVLQFHSRCLLLIKFVFELRNVALADRYSLRFRHVVFYCFACFYVCFSIPIIIRVTRGHLLSRAAHGSLGPLLFGNESSLVLYRVDIRSLIFLQNDGAWRVASLQTLSVNFISLK